MPKTTYLARVSVVSSFVDDGRIAFIYEDGMEWNVMEWNVMKWNDVILN